jgi:cytochrome c
MTPRSTGLAVVIAALAASAAVAATPATSASAAPDGGALFKQRCQGCHVVTPGQPPVVAPNLAGIVGRKAGAGAGYQYSDALKGANITWTKANLDKFLAGPQQMVPGTRMIVKVSDPAERAAIINFLATARH